MFAIKRAQRESMGEPAFVDRTMAYLRREFIEHVVDLGDDELRLRVVHGLEKARSHGLTWESSLTIFVTHMLTINPAFDEHPAVRAVLVDPEIPGDEKMQALLGAVEDHEWDEAAKQRDAKEYWQSVHEASGPAEAAVPRATGPKRGGSRS